jgi:hypothetical protein
MNLLTVLVSPCSYKALATARVPAQLTFDGRIILIDEMALDQLYGQTRLSYAATADDYELILAEKLQQGSERAAEGRGLGRRTFDAIVYMEDGPAWAPGVKG